MEACERLPKCLGLERPLPPLECCSCDAKELCEALRAKGLILIKRDPLEEAIRKLEEVLVQ